MAGARTKGAGSVHVKEFGNDHKHKNSAGSRPRITADGLLPETAKEKTFAETVRPFALPGERPRRLLALF